MKELISILIPLVIIFIAEISNESFAQKDSIASYSKSTYSEEEKLKPLSISWTKAANAIKYQIQVSSDSLFPEKTLVLDRVVNTNSIRMHGLYKNRRYFYRTRFATEYKNNLQWSNWGSQEIIYWIGFPIPAKPIIIEPKRDPDGISGYSCIPKKVRWEGVHLATEYQVQFGNSDFSNIELDTTVITTNLSSEVLKRILESPRQYYSWYWRVRAINNFVSSAWNEDGHIHGQKFPPNPATLLQPRNGAVGDYSQLKWEGDAFHFATEYRVFIADNPDFSGEVQTIEVPAEVTNLVPQGLTAGTTYYWYVDALSSNCEYEKASSGVWSFTAYCPEIPSLTLNSPSNNDNNINIPVELVWNSVLGVERYGIQIDVDPRFPSPIIDMEVVENICSVSDLLGGRTYFWRVRPIINCRVGEWSSIWQFMTCQEPLIPLLINPQNAGFINIDETLQWDDRIGNSSKYQLQIDNVSDLSSPEVDVETSSKTYAISSLSPGSSYFWRVRGFECAWGPWHPIWSFTVCLDIAIPTPTLSSPANGQRRVGRLVTFEWSNVSGAVNYELQVDNDNDFSSPIKDEIVGDPSYEETSLWSFHSGTTYYWRVRANNGCDWGDWSNTFLFTTKFLRPVLINPPDNSLNNAVPVLLEWMYDFGSQCLYLQKYTVHVYDEDSYDTPMVYNTNESSITLNLENGKNYYWKVRANEFSTGSTSFCNQTDWSEVWQFSTYCPPLSPPIQILPPTGTIGIGQTVVFDWEDSQGAEKYEIQIGEDQSFNNSLINEERYNSDFYTLSLVSGTTYYWRIRAYNNCGWGSWSYIWDFTP